VLGRLGLRNSLFADDPMNLIRLEPAKEGETREEFEKITVGCGFWLRVPALLLAGVPFFWLSYYDRPDKEVNRDGGAESKRR